MFTRFYHVCNDYSLDSDSAIEPNPDLYIAAARRYTFIKDGESHVVDVTLYTNIRHRELHFASINSGIDFSGCIV